MHTCDDPFKRPSRLLSWSEGRRGLLELSQFWAAYPLLALGPRGDGRAVLVIPGFLADDSTTGSLRRLLLKLGYRAESWSLGRNVGPSRRIVDGLSRRLQTLYDESGGRVSLIGWSLGGIYARDLARKHPELVREVISLGSPFRLDPREDNRHRTYTGNLWNMTRPLHMSDFHDRLPESQLLPLPVPATAIYSRTDGVVPWRSCLEHESETSESIEVVGSHCGLGHHVVAVTVILDRLVQPDGSWQPYCRLARGFGPREAAAA